MKSSMLFAAAMILLSANAADLKTKSGKVYKDYSIIGTCPEGLTILHSDGGGIVALEDWPDDKRAEITKHIERIEKRRRQAANRPDLTTKSGMVYKKYKILGFQTGGLKISFWSGTKVIDYSDLPDSMQKEYADKIAAVRPKSVVVFEKSPSQTRAPIDLKLDNPNSKAKRNDYKHKKKDKDDDEVFTEKPKKGGKLNKLKRR